MNVNVTLNFIRIWIIWVFIFGLVFDITNLLHLLVAPFFFPPVFLPLGAAIDSESKLQCTAPCLVASHKAIHPPLRDTNVTTTKGCHGRLSFLKRQRKTTTAIIIINMTTSDYASVYPILQALSASAA
jgi:hypothetical protein